MGLKSWLKISSDLQKDIKKTLIAREAVGEKKGKKSWPKISMA